MSPYQTEQSETLSMVYKHLSSLPATERQKLEAETTDYLSFRHDVDHFLAEYFGDLCTRKCYQSKLSACCSREGIITFFADVVINALFSRDVKVKAILNVLQKPNNGFKCIYLGEKGCLWRIKPIVCEMFICVPAQKQAFAENPTARQAWQELKRREKAFTWPDKPVLFDRLEGYFMKAGFSSPLMYLHNSPGLLRVKSRAKETKQQPF
jgi:hypothetical protein